MNNKNYKHTKATTISTNTDKDYKIQDDIDANVYSSYQDLVIASNSVKDFMDRIYKVNILLNEKETDDDTDTDTDTNTSNSTNMNKDNKIKDDINANIYSSYQNLVIASHSIKNFIKRLNKISVFLNKEKETKDDSDEK